MTKLHATSAYARRLSPVALLGSFLLLMFVIGSVNSPVRAATGSIFVANEWSLRTNESPAPTGYTSTGSVFSTFAENGRIIETDSDLVKVVINDSGLNTLAVQSVTSPANITINSGGDGNQTITASVGLTAIVEITDFASSPIAGSLADVQANTVISSDGGTTNLVGNQLTITNFFSGNGGSDPWIAVVVNQSGPFTINQINYETSAADTVDVTVRSELETVGIQVLAVETGIGTGRFEGFVRLVPNTASSINGSPGSSAGTAGRIRTAVGPVTAQFTDSDGVTRQTAVIVDTSAPNAAVTGPLDGSSTQNNRPTFSGSVSETGAGLDISSILVAYDDTNDPINTTAVINTTTGFLSGGAAVLPVTTTGALDGDSAFSFSQAPPSNIPSGVFLPDNIVDWVIRSSDLAGNVGIVDVDPTASEIQLPTVRIDRILPSFSFIQSDHRTGLADGLAGEVRARNSIRVAFNDQIKNVQPSDFTVTLDSGAVVAPVSATVLNDLSGSFIAPLSFGARSVVYLELAADLASSETPTIHLQDTISDFAGNFTSSGSTSVTDGIAPSLVITTFGGSGTGTGDEGPDRLTNQQMTIRIQSDEALVGSPAVLVTRSGQSVPELAPTALSQGANTWEATYIRPGTPTDGFRTVEVVATDASANAGSVQINDAFRLDSFIANPIFQLVPTDPPGTLTAVSLRPEITIDYFLAGEVSTVILTDVTLDGIQISGEFFRSANGRVHTFTPTVDLALGEHEIRIKAGGAEDAAGNLNTTDQSLTFTVDPPLAECRADTSGNELIERQEAVDVVVSYLLGRGEWTREEAIEVITAYLLQTPLTCDV